MSKKWHYCHTNFVSCRTQWQKAYSKVWGFSAPIVQKVVVLLWTFWTEQKNHLKSVGFFHRRKNNEL